MVCNNCGTQFADGNAFCPNCGTPAPQPDYVYAQQPIQPTYQAVAPGNPEEAKSCMITGILAAALACTFFASFMGIVFGIMGLNKSKKYIQQYGQYTAKIRVGKYCSIGGLAMGGFLTIYFIIYILAIIAAFASR